MGHVCSIDAHMRQLVSYDDIVSCPEEQFIGPQIPSSSSLPSKKRKRSTKRFKYTLQHWDEPDIEEDTTGYDQDNTDVLPDESQVVIDSHEEEEPSEYEESREVTHEDLWDDSALIRAWDAATAEYEAFHGTDKNWKSDPVRAPLWYNNPPSVKREANHSTETPQNPPSTIQTPDDHQSPSVSTVTQNEAFTNALGAMYWVGYWTAVYHSKSVASDANDDDVMPENGLDRTQY